jgi:hypothetical protein
MVSDAPIFDGDGVLIGIVGVTSDITHLKLAEAALRQANQELELRVKSVQRLKPDESQARGGNYRAPDGRGGTAAK